MGWENRNGRQYYYRKRRVGKRVVSEYVGAGFLAELQSELDQEEIEQRHAEREALREVQVQVRAVNDELKLASDYIRALTRASLLLIGYHPHKGQWRKRKTHDNDSS